MIQPWLFKVIQMRLEGICVFVWVWSMMMQLFGSTDDKWSLLAAHWDTQTVALLLRVWKPNWWINLYLHRSDCGSQSWMTFEMINEPGSPTQRWSNIKSSRKWKRSHLIYNLAVKTGCLVSVQLNWHGFKAWNVEVSMFKGMYVSQQKEAVFFFLMACLHEMTHDSWNSALGYWLCYALRWEVIAYIDLTIKLWGSWVFTLVIMDLTELIWHPSYSVNLKCTLYFPLCLIKQMLNYKLK